MLSPRASSFVLRIVFAAYAALAVARLWTEPERTIAHRVGHAAALLLLAWLAYRFAIKGGRLSRLGGILAYLVGATVAPVTGFVLLFICYFFRWSQKQPGAPISVSPPPPPSQALVPSRPPTAVRPARVKRPIVRPKIVDQAPPASTLLIDEFFESGDGRFLDEVLACRAATKLKSLAEPWYRDSRPFAREMLLRYVDDGCDRPCHKALVKKLFKLAEAAGDDEAMAHFMVAFDHLVRRQLMPLKRYQRWRLQQRGIKHLLVPDPTVPERFDQNLRVRSRINPQTGETEDFEVAVSFDRFSRRTRLYLERRSFRYFRNIGRKDKERYRRAILKALALYQDAHLQKPEQLLDSWGLLHALYWGSNVLDRRPRGVALVVGRSLSELSPAPLYPDAWKNAFEELLDLVDTARNRTVRAWSLALLRRDYSVELGATPLSRVRRLLASPHDEVQSFAAELLRNVKGLESLPLSDWLDLLKVENPLVLSVVCALVAKHVSPDRLTLAQSVELAGSRAASVAELGLRWAREKKIRDVAELRAIVLLGRAPVARVRVEATEWLMELLSSLPQARSEHLRELLDSPHSDVRAKAFDFMKSSPRFKDALDLWGALSESPYDDVRTRLLADLKRWEKALPEDSLRHVWITALLSIHRGGRAKQRVVRRVAERIVEQPHDADQLLPLLGIALRSVRAPERREGLAALSRAAFRAPELRARITQRLPELKLFEAEAR